MNAGKTYVKPSNGFTLIEILVSISLMGLFFYGLFGVLQTSLKVIGDNKARTTALALLNERLEFVQAISYDSVGTSSGAVTGVIPDNETIRQNNINFNIDTQIVYIDDVGDGSGYYPTYNGATCNPPDSTYDQNCIITDYKKMTVSVSWVGQTSTQELTATTSITPDSIETDVEGGILSVTVLDALGLPVSHADITIVNDTATPAVNATYQTNANGELVLLGVEALSDYNISAAKTNYSSDQTYASDVSNPNPVNSNITVVNYLTSSVTLTIDELSNLEIFTTKVAEQGEFNEPVDSETNFTEFSNLTINSGSIELEYDAVNAIYSSSGTARHQDTTVLYPQSWDELWVNGTFPEQTTTTVKLYYYNEATDSYSLVPNTELPQNNVGIELESSDTYIDLSGLSTDYKTVYPLFTLTSADGLATPVINQFEIRYTHYPPISVEFDLVGVKNIGYESGGNRIPKTILTITTDEDGYYLISDLEFDQYDLSFNSPVGYSLRYRYGLDDIVLAPNDTQAVTARFDTLTGSSLLAEVVDINNQPISGVEIAVDQGGVNVITTNQYGQAYLGELADGPVDVEIAAPSSYTNTIDINGETEIRINL